MVFVLTGLVSLVSLVLRFRRSRGEERQQIKRIAYTAARIATYLLVDSVFGEALDPISPILNSIVFGSLWIAIGVSILKYHLYDIDVLINRTIVYGTLTALLVAMYVGSVVSLQGALRTLSGQESQLAVVGSALLIAALFAPLRRRIQSFIDRRFYRRKYDARKTLEIFSARLRDETDLEALNAELVELIRETMQPAHVTLWLRPDTVSKKGEQTD